MRFEKYIKLKNLMRVHQLYQIDFQDRRFINDEGSIYDNGLPSEHLLLAMCELEKEGKYPKSSDLVDIITFVQNNSSARLLKRYLKELEGYRSILGKKQEMKTRLHHQIISDGLNSLPENKKLPIYEDCCTNLTGDYLISWDAKGIYLDVNDNGFIINAVRKYDLAQDTFIINDVVFRKLEFNELLNIISYSKYVKVLNLYNIQTIYNFLDRTTLTSSPCLKTGDSYC